VLNTDWGDRGHLQFLAVSLMAFAYGAAESWAPGHASLSIKGFPRTFARHVFGDTDGSLGDAIEALGSTYLLHGVTRTNADPLLLALFEPLAIDHYEPGRLVDHFTPDGLAATLAGLPPAGVWSLPQREPFEALALAEFATAARQTALHCLRSSIAWDLGMGRAVSNKSLHALADGFDAFAADLGRLWLARNKPSRLADNLRVFRRVAAEARKLTKRNRPRTS
jgi:hypothetical protein